MNQETIDAIREEFPDKNIVLLPEDAPTEVIVELSSNDKESVAVAFIDRSEPHYHEKLMEIYVVQDGTLLLHVDSETYELGLGDIWTIWPGRVHFAEGDATRVLVTCSPPWTPDDHVLV